MGWAFAARNGKSATEAARDMIIQFCEYTLHLDAFEATLAEISGAG
jgi:hypothetical protein